MTHGSRACASALGDRSDTIFAREAHARLGAIRGTIAQVDRAARPELRARDDALERFMSLRAIAEEEIPTLDAGRFEIIERIGMGGMAVVYKAIQKSVGRPVAVKVLTPEPGSEESSVARFVREATVISRLVHPNIVSLIDFGRDKSGNLLLVMELLEGESLRATLKRLRKLAPGRAVYIAQQILSALRVAHAAGVIHRDLKPENVFLTRVDGVEHVKVLDFGVAKSLSAADDDQTTMGALVGTLRYMAPEQMAGEVPDGRADVFSLGVILYEMLAGEMPFEGKDRFQLLRAVLKEPPTPLAQRCPELPAGLTAVVMRALAKVPTERWASAEEMRAALLPYAQAQVTRQMPAVTPSAAVALASARGGGSTPVSLSAVLPAAVPGPVATPSPFEPSLDAAPQPPQTTGQNTIDTTAAGSSMPGWSTLVGIAVGVLCFAAAAGILAARLHSSEAPQPGASSSASTGPSTSPSAGASSSAPIPNTVLVRTDPPGAVVADARSGVPLCSATPCAAPLLPGGLPRAITVRHGLRFAATVLTPGVASVDVALPPAPVATTAPSAQRPPHSTRRAPPGLRDER